MCFVKLNIEYNMSQLLTCYISMINKSYFGTSGYNQYLLHL